MEYRERVINGGLYQFLNALILDDADRAEITKHADCQNIEIELGSMEYLSVFPVVRGLILTGGIPTPEGFEVLYRHTELERLVLDFEETDTDEEGIDLSRFPNLQYVLSRSNLNILGYAPGKFPAVKTEVLNYYRDGKPIKVPYPDRHELFEKTSFWIGGVETCDSVGILAANMLYPVEKEFADRHFGEKFSEKLDHFKLKPFCTPPGFLNERRYISWKKRYADVRLEIPYHDFLYGNQAERIALFKQNISDAVDYVRRKDKTFAADRFLEAVWDAFRAVYQA